MYIDETIIAGLAVIVGTITFFCGFGYFIYQDQKKGKKP